MLVKTRLVLEYMFLHTYQAVNTGADHSSLESTVQKLILAVPLSQT